LRGKGNRRTELRTKKESPEIALRLATVGEEKEGRPLGESWCQREKTGPEGGTPPNRKERPVKFRTEKPRAYRAMPEKLDSGHLEGARQGGGRGDVGSPGENKLHEKCNHRRDSGQKAASIRGGESTGSNGGDT